MDRALRKLCCLPLLGPQVRDLSVQLNLVTVEPFLVFNVSNSSGLAQGFKGFALRSFVLEPYLRFRPRAKLLRSCSEKFVLELYAEDVISAWCV
jgi:hypothetical protein